MSKNANNFIKANIFASNSLEVVLIQYSYEDFYFKGLIKYKLDVI